MVPVRRKNGDIRIFIYFININKACQKDNFPLPTMEHLLQSVAGSELMSFLDRFLGYNQIMVHPDDRLKTTFRTNWGTYAYQKMPFGPINTCATFQRAMDIDFIGLINSSIVIYLDEITVYSKHINNHINHLKNIFERCRKYNISLNPKKCYFALLEGKLLGFIVSKQGIHIDPDRIKKLKIFLYHTTKKKCNHF